MLLAFGTTMPMRRALFGLALLATTPACSGAIAIGGSGENAEPDQATADDGPTPGAGGEPSGGRPATTPTGGTGGTSSPGPTTSGPATAFAPPREGFLLLPYRVRLNKLATLVGVPTTDPMFAELDAQRRELGDYDFAAGVAPDLKWTAKRMSIWVRALRPVCGSAAFKQRFPTIRGELATFVMRAYGRQASADDQAALDALFATPALDAAVQHRLACLALLSAVEFVTP